jgi:hypothetical protein
VGDLSIAVHTLLAYEEENLTLLKILASQGHKASPDKLQCCQTEVKCLRQL